MFSLKKITVLFVIILVYLPVSLDATILHVAVPTLNHSLNLTSNQLLWVIDIYALLMAGLLLPMGSLGDRIGYKKLMLAGVLIFGLASLAAAFSQSAQMLIASRALLALGASMILPATLACLRDVFTDSDERNMAIGVWAFVGGGGAALGPLVGGYILNHYDWTLVFLINIPIVLFSIPLIICLLRRQEKNNRQNINLLQALVFISAIIAIVFGLKHVFAALTYVNLAVLVIGLLVMYGFIRFSLRSEHPMIDFSLFGNPMVSTSTVVVVFSMVAVVGFELLMAQELQFTHGYSPLQAGLFMSPFILSFGLSSFLVVMLLNRLGFKLTACIGLVVGGAALLSLALIDVTAAYVKSTLLMVLLGVGLEMAFLSATSTILAAAPKDKAAAVGAIEGMAYELGTGLGVTLFGILLSLFYVGNLRERLGEMAPTEFGSSLGETIQAVARLSPADREAVLNIASDAFLSAHSAVLIIASLILFLLAALSWRLIPARS
ncbi:MFS transporter [Edwardsiella anguillarum]|uniref:MFS transporter n=1 Tax=Edwardsiella anguillarum TaxID=1821960 RepID=UPI0024B6B27E|nr:MFS transporter [Edwardsiella anguillarum]WHQ12728.1 MFS transporter [Edwardsiella anguillarum]